MIRPFRHRLNVRLFFTVASVLLVIANTTFGQNIEKRSLDHVDYDRWSTITRQAISDDGKWVMYTVQNGAIDGVATTHVFNPDSGKRYSLERVSTATFTHGGQFAIYRVSPEKKGSDNSEKIGPTKPLLYCLELSTGKTLSWAGVNSYATPKESGRWLACLLDAESMHGEVKPAVKKTATFPVGAEGLERKEKPLKLKSRKLLAEERGEQELEIRKESERGEERANAEAESAARESVTGEQTDEKKTAGKNNGSPMLVVDLETGMQRVFPNVSSFSFSKDGSSLAWVTSVKKSQEAKAARNNDASVDAFGNDGVHLLRLERFVVAKVMVGAGQYRSLTFSEDAKHLAFLSDHSDVESDSASWSLYLTPTAKPAAKKVAHETVAGLPIGWWISESAPVRFSRDSQRLYFETKSIPATVLAERKSNSKKQEAKDDSKKKMAKLDLWHWKDPQLQPQQLLQAQAEKKRTYKAAYVLHKKRVVQLETPTIPSVSIDERSVSAVAVANTNLPYRKSLSWDYPGFYDIYLVNLNDGTRRRVDQRVKWNAIMSPEGRYLAWFDGEKKQWYARSTRRGDSEPVLISRGIRQRLDDELHDTPNLPRPYGLAGWTTGDRFLIVYDRFDLWQLDLSGEKAAVCLTAGTGRKESVRYRYMPTDSEQVAIDTSKEIHLTAFNERTKASGYAKLSPTSGAEQKQVQQLIMLDERLSGFSKASNADRVIFTRSTFRDFPDLWCSKIGFKEITRVSDVNPQQDEYSWGTAELVHWKANDGQPLDGILLKPADFDPDKKYPMIVYFYERNSD
ncbi:MAG: S9 family peptidase, partial [Rubripirellula sp.]|nr:S9 family peptidase [Rubripirellula sp.]